MASPSNTPTEAIRLAAAGLFTGTIKAALVGSGWTFNRGSTEYRSSFNGHEVTGTNWPSGGVPCSVTVTADKNNHIVTVSFGAFSVANVTVANVRSLAIYKSTGSAATDPILLCSTYPTVFSKTGETLSFDTVDLPFTIGPDR